MYNRTQEQFGRATEAYSKSQLFARGEDLAWLVEAAAPRPEEAALDIGTAAGHTAFALAPHVGAVTGLDITPAMIETARANARERGLANFTGVVANAESLPFADATFDIVACRMTAHHFMQPELVMAEIARVLRPGGRLVVSDVMSPDDLTMDRWLHQVEILRDPTHIRDWNRAEWQRYFTEAGLTFELTRTWLVPLEFQDWTTRSQTPPDRLARLKELFAGAGPALRERFAIAETNFGLPAGVMRGSKADPVEG